MNRKNCLCKKLFAFIASVNLLAPTVIQAADFNPQTQDDVPLQAQTAQLINNEPKAAQLIHNEPQIERLPAAQSATKEYISHQSDSDPGNYVLINNESTNISQMEYTGNFQIDNSQYTLDKGLKLSSYQMDLIMDYDFDKNSQSKLNKNYLSINPVYRVGDKKDFWVYDLENELDYQINATLLYSGTKANIWVNNNQITKQDATKLGEEFDNRIYRTVVENFAKESDVDGDGKINILCYDIKDGFSGFGGYIGGYFNIEDLTNSPHSNRSEIFYVDTYPSMGKSATKDVTAAYDTLVHEFQHMVSFNQNVFIEGNRQMDPWISEAMSMAAEQIYSGQPLSDRIDYYNLSASIANGHSLLYWDVNGDLLANYSLSYLFSQYVKIQANQGDKIFKEILENPNSNYLAVEAVVKKYIDPYMSFGQFMTKFRGALLLKRDSGLLGFKGDPTFDRLEKKTYSGDARFLVGGGAIVRQVDSFTGYQVPTDSGANITYTLLSDADADLLPPQAPTIQKVSDQDGKLSGKTEANARVFVFSNYSLLGKGQANQAGDFDIPLTSLKGGATLTVFAEDLSGNRSAGSVVKVIDLTPPPPPIVKGVTDSSLSITGEAEPGANIIVTIGSKSYYGVADENGDFMVEIPFQAIGTKIYVTAVDAVGNKSSSTMVTVRDGTPPDPPRINPVTDHSTSIDGTADPDSIVFVKSGTNILGSKAVNGDRSFSIPIPKQQAGVILTVTAFDKAGNESLPTIATVLDKTPPEKPFVNAMTDYETLLTGTTEPLVTVIVTDDSGSEIGRNSSQDSGEFTVPIPKQVPGAEIAVYAIDKEGNIGKATTVTVTKKYQSFIGATRYETAVKVSQAGWKTAKTVLLVNGGAIVDGLTATPLAAAKEAPILLTKNNFIPTETVNELKRLQAKEIVLIGGTGVITAEVESYLKSLGLTVKRIGGQNRYDTSLLIAKELDKLVDVQTVYIAYGKGEPDALSISAQAGLKKQPIILTDTNAVPSATMSWLKSEGIIDAYFIGGTGVIAPSVIAAIDSLASKNVSANRISGLNRQETNANVISKFYPGSQLPSVFLCKSDTISLVDALTAGPLAAKLGGPVLLISNRGMIPAQRTLMAGKQVKYVYQIGGGVNPDAVTQIN